MFAMELRWLFVSLLLLGLKWDQTETTPIQLGSFTNGATEEYAGETTMETDEPQYIAVEMNITLGSELMTNELGQIEYGSENATVTELKEHHAEENESTEMFHTDLKIEEGHVTMKEIENTAQSTEDIHSVSDINTTSEGMSEIKTEELEPSSTRTTTTTETNTETEPERPTVCTDPSHRHELPDIKTQRQESSKWTAETVSKLMNTMVQLLGVSTKEWNGYQYVMALRGPDGSLYVPQHPQKSTREHLTALLGFAYEIIASKDALAHLDEEDSTATETQKYTVTAGSTLPESQDDITECSQKNHTEESTDEVLVETNVTTETLVGHEFAEDNEAKLNYENTSLTEEISESSEMAPHDSVSDFKSNEPSILNNANSTLYHTSELLEQTDISTFDETGISEPQVTMSVETYLEETVEGLSELLHKANENMDGLMKLIKTPALMKEKLENITKPFLADIEAVADTHLTRLLGQKVDEESSLKANPVSDEVSGMNGTQAEYEFDADTLGKIEAWEPSTEKISKMEQENEKEGPLELD